MTTVEIHLAAFAIGIICGVIFDRLFMTFLRRVIVPMLRAGLSRPARRRRLRQVRKLHKRGQAFYSMEDM